MDKILNFLRNYSLQFVIWVTTGALLLFFICVIRQIPSDKRIENLGDLLSGFAGAVAFIWLIAGFYQQARELKLQREELQLQRKTLEEQKAEFHELNKHQNLTHIKNILDKAEEKIGDTSKILAGKIFSIHMNKHLSNLLKSENVKDAYEESQNYVNGLLPIREFLTEYKTALMLSLNNDEIDYSKHSQDHLYTFIRTYNSHAKNNPYLSKYSIITQSSLHIISSIDVEKIEKNIALLGLIFGYETFGPNLLHDNALENEFSKFIELYGEDGLAAYSKKFYLNNVKNKPA